MFSNSGQWKFKVSESFVGTVNFCKWTPPVDRHLPQENAQSLSPSHTPRSLGSICDVTLWNEVIITSLRCLIVFNFNWLCFDFCIGNCSQRSEFISYSRVPKEETNEAGNIYPFIPMLKIQILLNSFSKICLNVSCENLKVHCSPLYSDADWNPESLAGGPYSVRVWCCLWWDGREKESC